MTTNTVANVYSIDTHINYRDIYLDNILKPSGIISLMQLGADNHSILAGNDGSVLTPRGIAWVISKYYIEVFNQPINNNVVQLTTWPSSRNRVDFVRNYTICNQYGTLVNGLASWCLIDINTRRLLPSNAIDDYPYQTLTTKAIETGIPRQIINKDNLAIIGERVITRTLIDRNNHMNNTYYMDIFFDYVPINYLTGNYSLSVTYSKECLIDDTIQIKAYESDDAYYLVIFNNDNIACSFVLRVI